MQLPHNTNWIHNTTDANIDKVIKPKTNKRTCHFWHTSHQCCFHQSLGLCTFGFRCSFSMGNFPLISSHMISQEQFPTSLLPTATDTASNTAAVNDYLHYLHLCYVFKKFLCVTTFWILVGSPPHQHNSNFSLDISHHKSTGNQLHVCCAVLTWYDLIWHDLTLTMTHHDLHWNKHLLTNYLLTTTGSINWDAKHQNSFQTIYQTQQNWSPYLPR